MRQTDFQVSMLFNTKLRRGLKLRRNVLQRHKQSKRTYYNRHRREAEFQGSQEVLLSTAHIRIASPRTPKLLPKFIGPFKVQARQAIGL